MARSDHYVRENAELVWFFRDAACALGARALPLAEAGEHGVAFEMSFGIAFEHGGQPSPPPPSARAQAAARKQALCRRAFLLLGSNEQALLECAYGESTRLEPELVSRHGVAAAVVRRVALHSSDKSLCDRAVAALQAAQDRYEAIRHVHGIGDKLEVEAAARSGQARRACLLESLRGGKADPRTRARAQLEELADVMRRAMGGQGA